MANTTSAKKATRKIARRTTINKSRRTQMRGAVRQVEDALKRQQRAKGRFLTATVAVRPASAKDLRQSLGRDDHRAIADEMARFL